MTHWLFKDLESFEEAAPKLVKDFLLNALNKLFEAEEFLAKFDWSAVRIKAISASHWIFELESRIPKEHKDDRKKLFEARQLCEKVSEVIRGIGTPILPSAKEEAWAEVSRALDKAKKKIVELLLGGQKEILFEEVKEIVKEW